MKDESKEEKHGRTTAKQENDHISAIVGTMKLLVRDVVAMVQKSAKKMMTYNIENDGGAIAETVAVVVKNVHDVADESEKVITNKNEDDTWDIAVTMATLVAAVADKTHYKTTAEQENDHLSAIVGTMKLLVRDVVAMVQKNANKIMTYNIEKLGIFFLVIVVGENFVGWFFCGCRKTYRTVVFQHVLNIFVVVF